MGPDECETAAIQLAVTGRLTYFKDAAALQGRVILQPDWLTAAISYLLKDPQIVADGGVVSIQRLFELWTNPTPHADGSEATVQFKRDDVPFLIELMHLYGVAFRLPPPADDAVLVSQRVPQLRPTELGRPSGAGLVVRRIEVELASTATKASLIPGLITRAHQYASEQRWWQAGVVFEDPTQRAWAIAETQPIKPVLTLTVIGPRPEAFFSMLRSAVEDRLSEWPGLSPTFKVLCPTVADDGTLCSGSWLHRDLTTHLELEEETVVCTTCRTRGIPVAELLGYLPTSTIGGHGGAVELRQADLAQRFERDGRSGPRRVADARAPGAPSGTG